MGCSWARQARPIFESIYLLRSRSHLGRSLCDWVLVMIREAASIPRYEQLPYGAQDICSITTKLPLQDGEKVTYMTSQGEVILTGVVRIDPSPQGISGILCCCCNKVISCSQFEAHAGRGSRRWDFFYNTDTATNWCFSTLDVCVRSAYDRVHFMMTRDNHAFAWK